jgi:hypothetical protein
MFQWQGFGPDASGRENRGSFPRQDLQPRPHCGNCRGFQA